MAVVQKSSNWQKPIYGGKVEDPTDHCEHYPHNDQFISVIKNTLLIQLAIKITQLFKSTAYSKKGLKNWTISKSDACGLVVSCCFVLDKKCQLRQFLPKRSR